MLCAVLLISLNDEEEPEADDLYDKYSDEPVLPSTEASRMHTVVSQNCSTEAV